MSYVEQAGVILASSPQTSKLLMVTNKSGGVLFSHHFDKIGSDEQLVGAGIVAFMQFLQEIFLIDRRPVTNLVFNDLKVKVIALSLHLIIYFYEGDENIELMGKFIDGYMEIIDEHKVDSDLSLKNEILRSLKRLSNYIFN